MGGQPRDERSGVEERGQSGIRRQDPALRVSRIPAVHALRLRDGGVTSGIESAFPPTRSSSTARSPAADAGRAIAPEDLSRTDAFRTILASDADEMPSPLFPVPVNLPEVIAYHQQRDLIWIALQASPNSVCE